MRLWYVRRGASWAPLLTCCGIALVAGGGGRHWPGAAVLAQPTALACCAAAAAFVFDEPAVAVVTVAPRGAWWRRSARLALVSLPLLAWVAALGLLPDSTPTHRPSWLVAGVATTVVAAGVAALCARHQAAAPGAGIAAGVTGAVLTPVVVGPVAGWRPLLPLEAFPSWLMTLWCVVAALGLVVVGWAVRPGVR